MMRTSKKESLTAGLSPESLEAVSKVGQVFMVFMLCYIFGLAFAKIRQGDGLPAFGD